ncbi:MAG: hypothetical protein ACKOPI_00900, partial [bacterium]
SCGSGKSYDDLADGSHTFQVQQRDRAGNTSPLASRTWTVDTTPPDAPTIDTGPSATTGLDAAIFRFSGEEATTFRCSLDEAEFETCSSPVSVAGLDDGEHRFEVRQIDTVGNASEITSHTWTVDTTAAGAPQIVSAPDSISGSDSAVFEFLGDTDSTFVCSLDDSPMTQCSSPVSYSDLGEGQHVFSVRQIDPHDNESPVSSFEWTVDTVAPDPPGILTPEDDFTAQADLSLTFQAESGTRTFCSLDGAPPVECTSPFSAGPLVDGEHHLVLFSRDHAGNSSAETSRSWTVDTVAPSSPSIDAGPSGLTQSKSASFGFYGEENATLECQLDSGSWSACTSPKSFSSVSDGLHTFRVRQFDLAENLSAESSRSWTVDTTAPNLLRIRHTKRTLPYTFALTLSETGSGLSRVEFSSARTRPPATAAPKTTYPLSGSTISLRLPTVPTFARVRDAAGNWSDWVSINR